MTAVQELELPPTIDEQDALLEHLDGLAVLARSPETTEDAIREIYRHVMPVVQNTVGRFALHFSDVPDFAQEAVIRVVTGIQNGKYEPGNLLAWTTTVTRNQVMSRIRAGQRQVPAVSLDVEGVAWRVDQKTAHEQPSAEDEMIAGLSTTHIKETFERAGVSKDFYEPFLLHHVDGMKAEEISTLLGININTIRTRIHRAGAKMREYYKQTNQSPRINVFIDNEQAT
jgi:RNA polymerase sigma-70 factor (ECF subfamily)